MKKNKKRIIIIAAVVAVIVIAVAGIIFFLKNRSSAVVDVYPMDLLNSSSWFENDSQLSGTITSDYVQEVYPDADQTVQKVYVKQGDTVKEGDKLLKYNVDEQELDVKLQQLQIKAAKLEIEKMEKELAELKETKTVGALDSSSSNLLNASLNLYSVGASALSSIAEETASTENKNTTEKSAAVKEDADDSVKLNHSVTDINQKHSGDGKTQDTEYSFLLVKEGDNRATIKGNVIKKFLDGKTYAVFKEYESQEAYNNKKDPLKTFRITSEQADVGLEEDKIYTLEEAEKLVVKKQLKESITSVNNASSGDGTKEHPYIFYLSDKAVIKGSVIQDLIEKKKYASFEQYSSEKALHNKEKAENSLELTPESEKSYVLDEIQAGTEYTLSDIITKLNAKLRKKITASDQYDSGDGSEGSHYIFLLNDGGTVKGSVILELIKNEYYAYFREYKSEDSYKSDKKNPEDQLEIRPELLSNGMIEDQEYTVDELRALLKEPSTTTVLKSSISDKEKDAFSGKGTVSDPYVYLLIQNGTIRGSVINDLMTNQQYACFYEYESEEVYQAGTDNNPVQITIRPGMIFKESLSSFAAYTITDLNNLIVTADKIEITPVKKKVKTGKTYTFKTKLTGKNKEALSVTWELKRNKSNNTTLNNGVLTVGADETAKTLRIIARAGDKKAVLTLTVVKSSSSSPSSSTSSGKTSGSSTSGGGDIGDSGDVGDSGDSYTAEELKEAISEKEDEIAEAKQDLNEAQINYKEAKKEVKAATVKATVSGKVTLAYTADAMPSDGSAAIIVRAEDGMYVKTSVSEMNLDTIQVGGTILCTSWENGEEYEAVVKEISDFPTSGSSYDGMSNPNSSYYPVVAYIADADGLSTGESVSISYSSQSMGTVSEDAIYLQKAYIRTEGKQSYVYKEGKNGKLTKQYIKTGETVYGQYIEVVSGVTMDDNLAFPYGKNVKEGAKVQLSDNEDDIIY